MRLPCYVYEHNLTHAENHEFTAIESNFGMFQSMGISDQGVNSLQWKDPDIFFFDRNKKVTNYAKLSLSNNVLYQASLARPIAGGKTASFQYEYRYPDHALPFGVPAEILINGGNGLFFRVNEFTEGSLEHPLPKEYFVPPSLFNNTNLAHVIESNGASYYVGRGKFYDLAKFPQPEISSKGEYFPLMGIIAFTILLIPGWLFMSKRRYL